LPDIDDLNANGFAVRGNRTGSGRGPSLRRATRSRQGQIRFETLDMKLLVITLTLLAAACKPLSTPLAGADPSDPSVPVPKTRYQSSLGSYERQRPVNPGPWREQNERVAPQPKGNNP
jgi:hypothetical protein